MALKNASAASVIREGEATSRGGKAVDPAKKASLDDQPVDGQDAPADLAAAVSAAGVSKRVTPR